MKRGKPMQRRPLNRVGEKGRARLEAGLPSIERGRINPRNDTRYKKARDRNFNGPSGDYSRRIAAMPCCACGHPPPSAPAHVVGRKAGSAGGDWRQLVPLCADRIGVVGCHSLWDVFRWKFRERFPTVDLAEIAARLSANEARKEADDEQGNSDREPG